MAYIVTTETTLSDGAVNNIDVSIPAGHQADDVCILFVTQDGGGTVISTPTGFTQIGTQSANQAQRTTAFQRVLTSNSEPDINMTGSNDEWIVTAVLVRGADITTPIHQEDRTNSANSTSNSLTSGSVTTSINNCLVLVAFGFDNQLKLTPQEVNDIVTIAKEANIGCVQTVHYFNQITAGATPTITALSEVQSEGGSVVTIAIADATPSTPKLSPCITKAYDVIARYGGITTSATTVGAFIRHDNITWDDIETGLSATTIDGIGLLATGMTVTEISYQPTDSLWGLMTGISVAGSAIDTTGRWVGLCHAIPATNFSNKIFSVEFQKSAITTSRFGEKGVAVVFEDSLGNWVAFQMSRRQGMIALATYRYFVDVEQATPYDSGGAIDWSDIVRVGYLYHKRTTATNAHIVRVKNALLLEKLILVDGSVESPCNPAFAELVLGGINTFVGGHGAFRLATVQGKGQALAQYGVQYGNGSRPTFSDLSATSHELPLRADGSMAKRFWQIPDNANGSEYRIYAGADDEFRANACVIATDTRQDFIIDPSSSADAFYSFAGASIIGYDITHNVAGIAINGATLRNCKVTLNGGEIKECDIVLPADRVITNNLGNIRDCIFYSTGEGHAIEITATGTFNFFGNVFSGYGADGTTDAEIYNNSGGLVTITIQAGNQTPTIRNGAGASTVIEQPPIAVSATILADSRVQLYNVTTDTEIDNVFEATTAYEYIISSEASVGDTLRLRVTKKGYSPAQAVGVFTETGLSFLISQEVDEIYTTYGIDGETVTKFDPDYGNTEIDLVVASNFSASEFYCWFNFNLTTEDGIRQFYGGITAIDEGNIRMNSNIVSMKFDNTTTTNVFQNDNVRIFRADGAYPVENPTSGGGGIDLVWRNQVYTVQSGVSGLTTEESQTLDKINALTENSGGLRFTAKALEEAPSSSGGGASASDIYDYFTTGTRPDVFKADVSAIPTNPLLTNDARLDNLDASIASRLASGAYTAPANADIGAIKAKTDLLDFVSGRVRSIAEVVSDKTGYALTAGERTAIAVAVEQAILNEGDGQAILNAIVGAIGNQNVDEIALVASIRADMERNGGMLDQVPKNTVLVTDSRLDNLDATVSSRLPSASYTSPDNAGIASANTKLDSRPTLAQIEASTVIAKEATVATKASQASVTAIPTNPLLTNDARLDRLDVNVSTRATVASVEAMLDTKGYATAGSIADLDDGITAVVAELVDIEGAVDGVMGVVEELRKYERNRWRIVGNQFIVYDNDGTTPLRTFNLRDASGNPTMENPMERVPA